MAGLRSLDVNQRPGVLPRGYWLLVVKTLTLGLSEQHGNRWSTATGCPHCFESSGLSMSPLIRPAARNVPMMPIPERMDTLIEVWHMFGHSSSMHIDTDAIEEETRQIRERVRKELRSKIKDLQDARSLLVKQLEKLLELKKAHRSTTICWYSGTSGMKGRAPWGPVPGTLIPPRLEAKDAAGTGRRWCTEDEFRGCTELSEFTTFYKQQYCVGVVSRSSINKALVQEPRLNGECAFNLGCVLSIDTTCCILLIIDLVCRTWMNMIRLTLASLSDYSNKFAGLVTFAMLMHCTCRVAWCMVVLVVYHLTNGRNTARRTSSESTRWWIE